MANDNLDDLFGDDFDEMPDRPNERFWNRPRAEEQAAQLKEEGKEQEAEDLLEAHPQCISGTVTVLEEGDYGLYALILCDDEVERSTPSHYTLQDKLLDVAVDDYIRICYVGSEDIGKDSPMARYRVGIKKK